MEAYTCYERKIVLATITIVGMHYNYRKKKLRVNELFKRYI